MSETSENANPSQPEKQSVKLHVTRLEMLGRFWDLCVELHGHPAPDFSPSQSAALKLIPKLEVAQSEDAAIRSMMEDREGTLSLLCATQAKAERDGLDVKQSSKETDKNSLPKLDHSTLTASGVAWFFRESVA